MFCPIGYVPFSHVLRKVPTVTSSVYAKDNAFREQRRSDEDGSVQHFNRSSLDSLEASLFLRLTEKLFVASPAGYVLKFDQWPFIRQLVIGTISAAEVAELPNNLQSAVRATGKLYDIKDQDYQHSFNNLKSSRRTDRFQDFDDFLCFFKKFDFADFEILL